MLGGSSTNTTPEDSLVASPRRSEKQLNTLNCKTLNLIHHQKQNTTEGYYFGSYLWNS